jgi:hypothetical protein
MLPPDSGICCDGVGKPPGELPMKHSLNGRLKLPQPPIVWREAEFAARRINAEDTCDDRVSDNIFDIEDEWAEVDIIVHRLGHDLN